MDSLLISLITALSVILGVSWKLAIPVFIVFLVLKLIGVITWSWLCVCIPLIVLVASLFLVVLLGLILGEID